MKPDSTLFCTRHTLTNLFVVVGLLFFWGTSLGRAASYAFTNSTRINIPISGTATPYPSTITPTGIPGLVTNVAVTLFQFTHLLPDDVDLMLVGPSPNGGITNVLLMADAGGGSFTAGLQITFSNITTLTGGPPPYPPDTTSLANNAIYRPANYAGTDTFSGWSAPFNTNLNVFNGANPNNPWRLYIVDDSASGSSTGNIAGGWRLTLNTTSSPPVILKQPDDATVNPGGTATFVVQASGTPTLSYQWKRNGQIWIPFGQGGPSVTIPNVGFQDVGTYQVEIANGGGTRSSRVARLFLNGPIAIDPLPIRVVPPGEDVIFEARSAGTPPLRYQWTLNGEFIPGETNATLQLLKTVPRDGGAYAVIVWNDDDAVTSQPGRLRVLGSTTNEELQDDFRDAKTVSDLQGVIQGDSTKATVQPGEPVWKGGGRSVWFRYVAPDSGIMTLNTRGSAFDTLLQVYAGEVPDPRNRITRDNDRAGFYTSTLQFNAQRGMMYLVQVDGFGLNGDGGEITLSWNLLRTTERVPIIVDAPEGQAVQEGTPVTFSIVTDYAEDRFIWYFEGNRVGTERTLTIPSAKREHVGYYWVEIRNANRLVVSEPVDLQVGTAPDLFSYDKFEYMFLPRGGQNFGLGAMMFAPASGGEPAPGFISIGLGDLIGKMAASTQAKNQPADPNPCGSLFSGTIYQRVLATNTGTIQVDTAGSAIPVRLAVYLLSATPTPPIVCDLTSATNGVPATVQFDAVQGVNYSVVLAGYQATGTVQINLQMGSAPPLAPAMQHLLVASNATVHLQMPATNWFPDPACQWFYKGLPMVGQTGPMLTVANFDAKKEGVYSVWMSNFLDAVTYDVAELTLAPPFTLKYSWTTNGPVVGYTITASNTAPFVIQTALSPAGPWLPIATNPDPSLILYLTNANAFIDPQRFYRAAPWP